MHVQGIFRLPCRAFRSVRYSRTIKLRESSVCFQKCTYLTLHKPFIREPHMLKKWIPTITGAQSMYDVGPREPNWNLQVCLINTNKDRFHEKPGGVFFRVQYIDTAAHYPQAVREKMPTVLALPTSPGTHKDLFPLVSPLAYRGVRVLIPNWPGFEYTEQLVMINGKYVTSFSDNCFYTQSSPERMEFILRFLSHLHVTELDLALGSGYGSVPLLVMLNTEFGDYIKSAMFLCPTPVHYPSSLARPRWWVNAILDLIDGRNVMTYIGLILPNLHTRYHGLKARHTEERFNAIQLAGRVGFYGIPDFATAVGKKKKPFSFLFTQNEQFFKTSDYVTYAEMLGIPEEAIYQPGERAVWKDTFDSKLKRAALFPTPADNPQKYDVFRDFIVRDMFHLLKLGHANASEAPQKATAGEKKGASN